MAAHGVVVGGDRAGPDEHVFLDERESRQVDVGLHARTRAEQHVVVEHAAASHEGAVPDTGPLAHERLLADDRSCPDLRAGEQDRAGAHADARADPQRAELAARAARSRVRG